MKKSLKLMLCIMFAVSFSNNALAGKCGVEVRRAEEQQRTPTNLVSNTWLKNNPQIAPYIPKDLRGEPGIAISCDEDGTIFRNGNKNGEFVKGLCFNYQSTVKKTSWRIRYSNSNANKSVAVNDSVATEVFRMTQDGPILWASFTGRRILSYTSTDARKFAGNQGGNTEIAGNPQQGNQQDAGVTKEEIVKQGVGAVIEGLKGFKPF